MYVITASRFVDYVLLRVDQVPEEELFHPDKLTSWIQPEEKALAEAEERSVDKMVVVTSKATKSAYFYSAD